MAPANRFSYTKSKRLLRAERLGFCLDGRYTEAIRKRDSRKWADGEAGMDQLGFAVDSRTPYLAEAKTKTSHPTLPKAQNGIKNSSACPRLGRTDTEVLRRAFCFPNKRLVVRFHFLALEFHSVARLHGRCTARKRVDLPVFLVGDGHSALAPATAVPRSIQIALRVVIRPRFPTRQPGVRMGQSR